jgi:phosphonate transport system permease protein
MLLNLVRAVPDFIVALLLVRVTGFCATTGILALGIHSIGMLGKLFSEAIEAVDEGPLEAVRACGGTRWQVIFYGVMPQVTPYFTGYSLYRWDINVRSGVVLGLVGAGGIGFDFMNAVNVLDWREVSMAILVILVTITAFDLFSTALRNRVV